MELFIISSVNWIWCRLGINKKSYGLILLCVNWLFLFFFCFFTALGEFFQFKKKQHISKSKNLARILNKSNDWAYGWLKCHNRWIHMTLFIVFEKLEYDFETKSPHSYLIKKNLSWIYIIIKKNNKRCSLTLTIMILMIIIKNTILKQTICSNLMGRALL